jgi:dTDP-4-amino-4,6-dideoxygalactose transaminase
MESEDKIPFNWPYMTGKELYYIANAHFNGRLAGDGPYTQKCHTWLESYTRCKKALLTHSCTAALEMSALLMDLNPGDEIIMPSYTFVSTANAFVLRGAVPVFVDVREDTLNLDERFIESAITERTRAIVPVHYAGISCEMDAILAIAKKHNLFVIEDAAQGLFSNYKNRPLGGLGDLGAFSFHETKNIISGEGGALIINNETFIEQAEIIREKGTDRSKLFRGEIDKYTWQTVGSSYLPGELIAAFLWAQLEEAWRITNERLSLWEKYHNFLEPLENEGLVKRPIIPQDCQHNAHMYFVLVPTAAERKRALEYLKKHGVFAIFHYIPLHDSPAGKRYGRPAGEMSRTINLSERIIRLPLWIGLTESKIQRVVQTLRDALVAR